VNLKPWSLIKISWSGRCETRTEKGRMGPWVSNIENQAEEMIAETEE
jgi:hypothetical protein